MCAAKKTGKAVALSVNLPAGEPLMRAWAEKRLLQELQALQLVRRGLFRNRAGGAVLSGGKAQLGRLLHGHGSSCCAQQPLTHPTAVWSLLLVQVQQTADLSL